MIHDDDAVGFEHRREPVRDDDGGASRMSFSSACCTSSSDSASRELVASSSKQNRRILQNRPRQRDALPLAAGEPRAALAEKRVVSLRELAQEAVGGRGHRRRLDFRVGRVGRP